MPYKPAKQPTLEPIVHYYTPEVFNSLASGKQHMPMIIILDPLNDEKENSENVPLSSLIARSILARATPLLITGSVLRNLLVRTRTYPPNHPHSTNDKTLQLKEVMDHASLDSSAWSAYDVPDSQFILLIPKSFTQLITPSGKNMGIKKLPSLDHLLPKDATSVPLANQTYQDLITWLDAHKNASERTHTNVQEYEKILSHDISKDLEKIFVNKSDDSAPIWDIFIDGHGTVTPAIIAGLNPAAFNKMLTFFDQKIKTGIVYVLSCSAGGQNRTLLETTQDGVHTNHTFTLILGSISNSVAISEPNSLFLTIIIFLNNAGFIQDKGTSINNLMRYITRFEATSQSYHGATRFPQIWFPGGYGFQTPQMIEGALSLGNVFLKTHKENGQPINVKNTVVILLYPTVIDVPLTIAPFNMGANMRREWKHYAFVSENSFFESASATIERFIINALKSENILPDYLLQLPELAQADNPANPNYYLYPQFISMAPGKAHYLFSKITVSSNLQGKQVAGGILQFIRDAFFDPVKKSDHTYLIDSLTGTNDISITLAASRLLAKGQDEHPLEKLLKDRANKEITLKNVLVDPSYNYIGFQIDNTIWVLNQDMLSNDPTVSMRWNFGQMDNKTYEDYYKSLRAQILQGTPISSQKNISEVLKEKQQQAVLKKAVEAKRKEAAQKAVKKYQEAQKK